MPIQSLTRFALLPTCLMLLMSISTVLLRPAAPIDETRYLTVAWEMHESGDFLVSHLNGETYAHKPPLLFWLINIVWSVFGTEEAAARLVAPAFSVVSLWLTILIARRIWPDDSGVAVVAPLIQCSLMLWMVYAPTTMFDSLLTVFAQTGLLGILQLDRGRIRSGTALMGLGLGLGILSKGPVIFVHVLPAAALGFLWSAEARQRKLYWYGATLAGVIAGVIIAAAWALPSAMSGGEAYADELLWGQTAGRMVDAFAHRKAWWWYAPAIVPCALPWLLFRPLWMGLRRVERTSATMFCSVWCFSTLGILTLISAKQPHYLLPSAPGAALLIACVATRIPVTSRSDLGLIAWGTIFCGVIPPLLNHLPGMEWTNLSQAIPDLAAVPLTLCGLVLLISAEQPTETAVRRISTCAAIFFSCLIAALSFNFWHEFDLMPVAKYVRTLMDDDIPVAWYGSYHGRLQYLGRLSEPVAELHSPEEVGTWLASHPNGRVLFRQSLSPRAKQKFPDAATSASLMPPELKALEKIPAVCSRATTSQIQTTRSGLSPGAISVIRFDEKQTADTSLYESGGVHTN